MFLVFQDKKAKDGKNGRDGKDGKDKDGRGDRKEKAGGCVKQSKPGWRGFEKYEVTIIHEQLLRDRVPA